MIKIEFTPLPDCNILPFFKEVEITVFYKGFKKSKYTFAMPRARAGIVLSHYVRDVQAFKIKDTFLNDEIARPTISRSTSPSL